MLEARDTNSQRGAREDLASKLVLRSLRQSWWPPLGEVSDPGSFQRPNTLAFKKEEKSHINSLRAGNNDPSQQALYQLLQRGQQLWNSLPILCCNVYQPLGAKA